MKINKALLAVASAGILGMSVQAFASAPVRLDSVHIQYFTIEVVGNTIIPNIIINGKFDADVEVLVDGEIQELCGNYKPSDGTFRPDSIICAFPDLGTAITGCNAKAVRIAIYAPLAGKNHDNAVNPFADGHQRGDQMDVTFAQPCTPPDSE